jgi:cytochrome c oxidase subunit 4
MEEVNTPHPANYGIYIVVWFGLVGLTLLTVSVAGLNLASLTVAVAIAIAIVKSLLVTNYFMHVRTDSRVFKVFIFVSLVMFLTLIILTFFDITFRAGGK